MAEHLTPERAARILHAHAGNLETHIQHQSEVPMDAVTFDLLSATSMVCRLLAEFFDSSTSISMTKEQEEFVKGFEDGRGLSDRE